MFADDLDRGPASNLRGWLSDVYIPSILQGTLEPLAARLGGRATLDDPTFGRTPPGLDAIKSHLANVSEWLTSHDAKYTRGQFTTGIDRDLTEGTLTLYVRGVEVALPIAVVAERRRSREVELRTYYAASLVNDKPTLRAPHPHDDVVVPPQGVSDLVKALRGSKLQEALAMFEANGVLRDARGVVHARADGSLEKHLRAMTSTGWDAQKLGTADDGRTCAFEYAVTVAYGRTIAPQAALAAIERGESGLIRELRAYDDLI